MPRRWPRIWRSGSAGWRRCVGGRPTGGELGEAGGRAEDRGGGLRRLGAAGGAAAALPARPRLGSERFGRGAPERHAVTVTPLWTAGLAELFAAYGALMQRGRMSR